MSRKGTFSKYHSALSQEACTLGVDRCEFSSGVAFRWSIMDGLPKEFSACDVIYSDPPWRAGVEKFNKRAGVSHFDYNELVNAISKALRGTKIPAFLMVGKSESKQYQGWESMAPIRSHVHGGVAVLIAYNYQLPILPDGLDTEKFILWLAKKFNCVGDFCCGYGTTGRLFEQAGKRSVMCDYNSKCIARVQELFEI